MAPHGILLSAILASAVALMRGAAAWAVVPDSAAPVDSLGIAIKPAPHVYRLPAGSVIYHGTFNNWEFSSDPRQQSTWFGADRETSEAMAYFRWCNDLNAVMTSYKNGKLAETNGNINVLNPDLTPKIMTVMTKVNIDLLFVGYGSDGHKQAFSRIGYQQPTSLYGVGSEKGLAALTASKLCGKQVGTENSEILPSSQWPAAKTKLVLQGWRAPWDQNEIALCPAVATSATLEKRSIETLSLDPTGIPGTALATIKARYADVYKAMNISDPANKGKDFQQVFLEAFKVSANAAPFSAFLSGMRDLQGSVCSVGSPLKTRSDVGPKNSPQSGWFDITFKQKRPTMSPSITDDASPLADLPSDVKSND